MHPFTKKSYLQLIALLLILALEPIVNLDFHPILAVVITSISFAICFLSFVWFSKMSEEINSSIRKLAQRLGLKL